MSSPATSGRCARLRRATLTGLVVPVTLLAQAKPRERDLGSRSAGPPAH
ncbi:MAG: hypothetical protein IPK33_24150 [Gemmatimonadetes bacterium]|nr:hypothetical protein [Gemmatimonadota bacterium]